MPCAEAQHCGGGGHGELSKREASHLGPLWAGAAGVIAWCLSCQSSDMMTLFLYPWHCSRVDPWCGLRIMSVHTQLPSGDLP